VMVNSGGFLVEADDTASSTYAGIAEESCTVAQSTENGAVMIRVRRTGIVKCTLTNTAASPTLIGSLVYCDSDDKIDLTANVTNNILMGMIVRHGTQQQSKDSTSITTVWVNLMGAMDTAAVSASHTTVANLISAANGKGAALVGVEDAGAFTSAVDVESALAELYRYMPVIATDADGTVAPSAKEFMSGVFTVSNAGAEAITLPATGVTVGAKLTIVKTGTIGLMTMGATALIGAQCTGNFFYGCYNPGDSVTVMCLANDSYAVVAVSNKRTQYLAFATGSITDEIAMSHAALGLANGAAGTVEAASAANLGADLIVYAEGATATVVCAAGFGGTGAGDDTISLTVGEMCHIYSDGAEWFYTAVITAA